MSIFFAVNFNFLTNAIVVHRNNDGDGTPWVLHNVSHWNQPLTEPIAASDFDLSNRARTFALVYFAAADSSIACWATKYEYNFWGPQPAIQRGDEDGNDFTSPDPTWTPIFPTPRHPEYTSGHTTNSTAMATILQLIFGDAPGVPITSTITASRVSGTRLVRGLMRLLTRGSILVFTSARLTRLAPDKADRWPASSGRTPSSLHPMAGRCPCRSSKKSWHGGRTGLHLSAKGARWQGARDQPDPPPAYPLLPVD